MFVSAIFMPKLMCYFLVAEVEVVSRTPGDMIAYLENWVNVTFSYLFVRKFLVRKLAVILHDFD